MSKEKVALAIDKIIPPSEHGIDVKKSILDLYELIVGWAIEANSIDAELRFAQNPEYGQLVYRIQQTICWTPLRHLLFQLATDEYLEIRAAAKGEQCDRSGGADFAYDQEIGLMSEVNLPFILDPSAGMHQLLFLQANPQYIKSTKALNTFLKSTPLATLSQDQIVL